jgi:hypothetical protein
MGLKRAWNNFHAVKIAFPKLQQKCSRKHKILVPKIYFDRNYRCFFLPFLGCTVFAPHRGRPLEPLSIFSLLKCGS